MLATYVQKSLDLILELCPMQCPLYFGEKNCARELQKISQRIFQHCTLTYIAICARFFSRQNARGNTKIKQFHDFFHIIILRNGDFAFYALKGNGNSNSLQICIARMPQMFSSKSICHLIQHFSWLGNQEYTYTPIADGVSNIGCGDSICHALPVLTEPIGSLDAPREGFEVQRLDEVGRTCRKSSSRKSRTTKNARDRTCRVRYKA